MAENEEELKSVLMKMKEESEKVRLKVNIQKTEIIVSYPIQFSSVQFSHSVMSDSLRPYESLHARPPLSITNSRSSLRLTYIESVMPSSHLIICHSLLFPPSIFPSIRVFYSESVLHIRWPKDWSFSFSMSPSNEYSALISLGWPGWISLQSKGS